MLMEVNNVWPGNERLTLCGTSKTCHFSLLWPVFSSFSLSVWIPNVYECLTIVAIAIGIIVGRFLRYFPHTHSQFTTGYVTAWYFCIYPSHTHKHIQFHSMHDVRYALVRRPTVWTFTFSVIIEIFVVCLRLFERVYLPAYKFFFIRLFRSVSEMVPYIQINVIYSLFSFFSEQNFHLRLAWSQFRTVFFLGFCVRFWIKCYG